MCEVIIIEGFADTDCGLDINDRKSFSGFCFELSNTVVSFECRKQRHVTLSSTEAYFWYQKLVKIVGSSEPIVIFINAQSAQKLVLNPVSHRRSKYTDMSYQFIKEAVTNNLIKIYYLEAAEMPASILTTSLGSAKTYYFMKKLGILPISY